MVLKNWYRYVERATELLDSLTDDELQDEVSDDRNTGIYLYGHLIAFADALAELLEIGEINYPRMQVLFIENPDKQGYLARPEDIRKHWVEMHKRLKDAFSEMSPDGWFEKHSRVSPEEFLLDDTRNKLGVLLNRTNHLSYHLGQLAFLRKKPKLF